MTPISMKTGRIGLRWPERFIYLKDLVPTVEKLLLLEAELEKKQSAVDAAEAELTDTPAGYKQTIARCKVRDAETARDAIADQLSELASTIPAPTEIKGSFYVQRIAELRIKRRTYEVTLKETTDRLDAEMEALKSGPWRRKDAPMPPAILRLQSAVSTIQTEITSINRQIAELAEGAEGFDELTRNSEAMYRWIEEDGPTPQWVIDHDRREREEILKNCVVLKIPKYVRVSGPAAGSAACGTA